MFMLLMSGVELNIKLNLLSYLEVNVMAILNQVIIVEGKTDKKRVNQVIDQPIEIICTNGTMGIDKLDEMIESLYDKQVYVLADADDEGEKIRKWFKKYLSESKHIHIDKQYGEVARCPKAYLSKVLAKHGFLVKDEEKVAKAKLDYIAERVSLLT